MIIVIEGVDGAGKTTLAGELSSRLNMPILKSPDTPLRGQSVVDSQRDDLVTVTTLLDTCADAIIDRLHPSEWAYGRAFNRDFDEDNVREIESMLRSSWQGFLGVFLRFSSPDAFSSRSGEFSVRDFERIQRGYTSFFKSMHGIGNDTDDHWVHLDALDPVSRHVEQVMLRVRDARPSKDEVYMSMARKVAERSTCLSRRTGAVLLSWDGHVIATGYNGAPTGCAHQDTCPRLREDSGSGRGLDLCEDVHAEENALIQAALNGASPRGGKLYTLWSPCHRCMRMIVNAKIDEVIYSNEYGDARALSMSTGVKMRRLYG